MMGWRTTLVWMLLSIGACGRVAVEPLDIDGAGKGGDGGTDAPSGDADGPTAASCVCPPVDGGVITARLPLECLCASTAGRETCFLEPSDRTPASCGSSFITRSVGCGRIAVRWDYQESGSSTHVFDEATGRLVGVAESTDTQIAVSLEPVGGICLAHAFVFGTLLEPSGRAGDARDACDAVTICTVCGPTTPDAPLCRP
jgi:hypothetical protein